MNGFHHTALAHRLDLVPEIPSVPLSDDELSLVLSDVLCEETPVTEDMILEITDRSDEDWYEQGERLSNPKVVDLAEVRAKRLLQQFNDLG